MGAIPSIQSNLTSHMARRNLTKANDSLKTNIEKLSTGHRINSAEDDAAGLAVSENMKADLRSISEARRNANDGVSMMQTADGSLEKVHDILGRMKELAVQANSDSINDTHREDLNNEYDQLVDELNDIANDTNFNDVNLLDGSFTGKTLQVGPDANDTLQLAISQNFNGTFLGKNFSVGDSDIEHVSTAGDHISFANKSDVTEFAEGQEFVVEMETGSRFTGVVKNVDTALNKVEFDAAEADLSAGHNLTAAKDMEIVGGLSSAGVDTRSHASFAAAAINDAIDTVSRRRADIGSQINRLDKKINNIDIMKENLASANSRIRDVDVASEMADLTQNQIVTQAGSTMLSQANSRPEAALTLLGG